MIAPTSIEELSNSLRSRAPGTDPTPEVSLERMNRLIRHTPEDMTATVQCGMTLNAFQGQLARSHQWLPIDPPDPNNLTIGDLLNFNLTGPRQFGYGTVRDWVIGMKFVLPDGRIVESGGNVVKNVAGYDLHKLMIGAKGTLAVLAEATFKVNPLPEAELFVSASFPDLESAGRALESVWDGPTEPHVLDMWSDDAGEVRLVVGFCGTRKEVEWQNENLDKTFNWSVSSLDHDKLVGQWRSGKQLRILSVAPSNLIHQLSEFVGTPFVARAGNGLIFTQGPGQTVPEPSRLSAELESLFLSNAR